MATTTQPATAMAEDVGTDPTDVLVVFGITGDLAKVMTFLSLYRLEQRGLLNCPIVGVAVDDWTADDLRKRARESIETAGKKPVDELVFERFAAAALLHLRRLLRSPAPTSASPPRFPTRSSLSSIWRSRRSCSAR